MKTIFSFRRNSYLKTVSIFLIAVILIAGVIVSCEGEGEGKPLDHFRGYGIDMENMPYIGDTVEVGDQFGNWTATLTWGLSFANPVEKTYNGVTEEILDEVCHFMGFGLEGIEGKFWQVTVDNQFGTQELIVYGPIALSVPTGKNALGEPQGYNCLLNYEVIDPEPIEVYVDLQDQFASEQNVSVTQAKGFANPAWMKYNGEVMEIVNEDDHAVGYWTYKENASTEKNEIVVSNVFGQWTINVTEPRQNEGILSVPSEKISWQLIEPPLDHFRCYNFYGEMPNPGAVVELKDQFGTFNATVGLGTTFCNPVEKAVNEIAAWELVPISHPDYHLVVYLLEGVEPIGEWVVEVNNQFGTQNWIVSGPGALAVPTRKDAHGEPVGLDYFLLYGINESQSMDVIVDLTDEFGGGDNNFEMVEPFAHVFGNPIQQITYAGNVTNIATSDDHLVFYWMQDEDAIPQVHAVEISNLFGQWNLDVYQGDEALLAVPSEKLSVTP